MKGSTGYAGVGAGTERGLQPVVVLWRQLRRWWQLAEQRRRLAALDERALKDIGLSRADVEQESRRPFWDDPCKT
ncbi:DUF1127 domain-containing protein [Aquipseudomonas campi]